MKNKVVALLASVSFLSACQANLSSPNTEAQSQKATAAVPALVKKVFAGPQVACATTEDDELYCWGPNNAGIQGILYPRGEIIRQPTLPVMGLAGVTSHVGIGTQHVCSVTDGSALCWGNMAYSNPEIVGGTQYGEFLEVPLPLSYSSFALSMQSGKNFSCGLFSYLNEKRGSGILACRGTNRVGQASYAPEDVPAGTFITTEYLDGFRPRESTSPFYVNTGKLVATGQDHGCVITENSAVLCWGSNEFGQLGVSRGRAFWSSRPIDPLPFDRVGKFVAAAGNRTCVTSEFGNKVLCWGDNSDGNLGVSGKGIIEEPATVIHAQTKTGNISKLAVGPRHACVLRGNSGLFCWGANDFGQLGNGATSTSANVTSEITTLAGQAIQDVVLGEDYTCATTTQGRLFCFGKNDQGQTGTGLMDAMVASPTEVIVPKRVKQPLAVASVGLGRDAACATLNNGQVMCFGANHAGIVGVSPSKGKSLVPSVAVAGLQASTAAKPGYHHECMITTDGRVQCWGRNALGQLGRGTQSVWHEAEGPADVVGLPADMQQVVNGYQFSCALSQAGDVYCWGDNSSGQLAQGSVGQPASSSTPMKVTLLSGTGRITRLAASPNSVCGIRVNDAMNNASVVCWGMNDKGQLGARNPSASGTPVTVSGLPSSELRLLAGGPHRFCAVAGSSNVFCWGDNTRGDLVGNSQVTAFTLPATQVNFNLPVADISVGRGLACVVTSDGRGFCWGSGDNMPSGGLATHLVGMMEIRIKPTPTSEARLLKQVSADKGACVVTTQDELYCWGDNYAHRFGLGANATVSGIVRVPKKVEFFEAPIVPVATPGFFGFQSSLEESNFGEASNSEDSGASE